MQSVIDFHRITVIELLGRDAMHLGLFAQTRILLPAQNMCMNGIKIILTDKNNRHLFEGGEIQTLIKNALFGSSITKKTDDQSLVPLEFHGVRITDRVWDRRADDGGRTHHSMSGIDQMHRTALAFGATGRFAVKLGEHPLKISAFC